MREKYFYILIVSLVFFSLAGGASAQLVPCGGQGQPDCTSCHLFELIKNVADFVAFTFTPIVAALMFIFAGFLIIISAGNQTKLAQGKKLFTNTAIAVAIIYLAWLMVNTTMRTLAKEGNVATKWYQLECSGGDGGGGGGGGLPTSGGPSGGTTGGGTTGGGTTGGGTTGGGTTGGGTTGGGSTSDTYSEGEARSILTQNGIIVNNLPCNGFEGCTNLEGIRRETIAGAIELKEECDCIVVVTGGTEPGHEPGVFSHTNGYKLDFGRTSELDSYIRNNYTYLRTRSDGAKEYRAPNGAIFAEEHNHWDVKGWDTQYSGYNG